MAESLIARMERVTTDALASPNPFASKPLPMLQGGKPVAPKNRYGDVAPVSVVSPQVIEPAVEEAPVVAPEPVEQPKVTIKPRKPRATKASEEIKVEFTKEPIQSEPDFHNPVVETRSTEGLPSYRCEFEGRDIFVGWPWYKSSNPVTAAVNVAMALDFGRDKIRFDMSIGDAKIEHSRNRLTHKFLETDAKWLLMMDDDIIPSIGRPAWFRYWVAGARTILDQPLQRHVLHRLIGANKTIVGAAYFGRQEGGAIMCADPKLAPRAKAYEDAVVPVDWVGTGCMLIHRKVFEDIRETFKDSLEIDVPDYTYDYFRPFDSARGEDVSFCLRAKQAGHQPHVDLGLPVFHVGFKTY